MNLEVVGENDCIYLLKSVHNIFNKYKSMFGFKSIRKITPTKTVINGTDDLIKTAFRTQASPFYFRNSLGTSDKRCS